MPAWDAALDRLRETDGLILDLRDTPGGGNTTVARGLLGRLVPEVRPYQRHDLPREERRYGIRRIWVEHVAPRGPYIYDKPVAALVGRWTASMGEGVAIGLDGARRGYGVRFRHGGAAGRHLQPHAGAHGDSGARAGGAAVSRRRDTARGLLAELPDSSCRRRAGTRCWSGRSSGCRGGSSQARLAGGRPLHSTGAVSRVDCAARWFTALDGRRCHAGASPVPALPAVRARAPSRLAGPGTARGTSTGSFPPRPPTPGATRQPAGSDRRRGPGTTRRRPPAG